MGYNNKMVDSMMSYQSDAFKNMYDVYIDWPVAAGSLTNTGNSGDLVSVRAKGFKVPDVGITTYERHYQGNKINLPKPEQDFERKVELTFTMDSGFIYYQKFCQWLSAVVDAVNGGTSNWPTLRGSLYVIPLTGTFLPVPYSHNAETDEYSFTSSTGDVSAPGYVNGTDGAKGSGALKTTDLNLGWKFKECWVSKVTAPEFAVDSAEPLEFNVTFEFLDFDAPGFGGFRTEQKDFKPATSAGETTS